MVKTLNFLPQGLWSKERHLSSVTYLNQGKEHLSSARSIPYQLRLGTLVLCSYTGSLSLQHLLLIERDQKYKILVNFSHSSRCV